jgi:hypothetical protein
MNHDMSAPELDERIRAALQARAEQVTAADLRPDEPSRSATRSATRWAAPLLVAAAVAAVAVGIAVVASQPQAGRSHRPAAPSGSSNVVTVSPATSTATSGPITYRCFFDDSGASECETLAAHYVPLWPFARFAQAQQWQGSGGSQPWHLDPRLTAQYFVRNYLGFTDLGLVTSAKITADEAHIGIGYADLNGGKHTAAVVHLVRYEDRAGDTTAPWEVVGTDDTTFSLERPDYGSTVTSPLSAGGHITGVDENIHVWVRSLAGVAGTSCCLPAGGNDRPWTRQLAFHAEADTPLTIVASTGGHLQEHERFAVQGVWAG